MSDKKTETRAVEPEAIYDAAEIAQNAQRLKHKRSSRILQKGRWTK